MGTEQLPLAQLQVTSPLKSPGWWAGTTAHTMTFPFLRRVVGSQKNHRLEKWKL